MLVKYKQRHEEAEGLRSRVDEVENQNSELLERCLAAEEEVKQIPGLKKQVI